MSWFCANCKQLVDLDPHGRCERCDSDAVDVAWRFRPVVNRRQVGNTVELEHIETREVHYLAVTAQQHGERVTLWSYSFPRRVDDLILAEALAEQVTVAADLAAEEATRS